MHRSSRASTQHLLTAAATATATAIMPVCQQAAPSSQPQPETPLMEAFGQTVPALAVFLGDDKGQDLKNVKIGRQALAASSLEADAGGCVGVWRGLTWLVEDAHSIARQVGREGQQKPADLELLCKTDLTKWRRGRGLSCALSSPLQLPWGTQLSCVTPQSPSRSLSLSQQNLFSTSTASYLPLYKTRAIMVGCVEPRRVAMCVLSLCL